MARRTTTIVTDEQLLRRLVREEIRAALNEWRAEHRQIRQPDPIEYIYALCDPGGAIRYIGRSSDPWGRLIQHMTQHLLPRSRRFDPYNPKILWLADLRKAGIEPELRILEKTTRSKTEERERYWIRWALESGADLVNTGDVDAIWRCIERERSAAK